MRDSDCVEFLQWALPRLHLRWPGFKKVRNQVCKRITRRMRELELTELGAYRDLLNSTPEEWLKLDSFCRIPISRFYRDRGVFDRIENETLPEIAQEVLRHLGDTIHCWSAGCALGEEPYTLMIVWKLRAGAQFASLRLDLIATDIDAQLLQRAQRGCYQSSSLKELPKELLTQAFERQGDKYCVKKEFREGIRFELQDLRKSMPDGPFHLIFCRNLAFTYFDDSLQRETLEAFHTRLAPGGFLVLGRHETLPSGSTAHWTRIHEDIYRAA